MKIYITGIQEADLDTVCVTMDNVDCQVSVFAGAFKDMQIVTESAGVYGMFINVPKQISAAKRVAGGTALTFTTITDDGINAFINFNTSQSVTRFIKGNLYFVPLNSGAVTLVIPTPATTPVAPLPNYSAYNNTVWTATHWLYVPTQDHTPIGTTSVTCATCELTQQGISWYQKQMMS